MRFKIISTGINCSRWLTRCLTSINEQEFRDFDVCVVDDASDDNSAGMIKQFCENEGWAYILNQVNHGAMHNQVRAIAALDPAPGDVIVWVDTDDALASPRVLDRLKVSYDGGALVTYGSYRPEPMSPTCPPALPYPPEVIQNRDFRRFGTTGGLWFNHLRTVSWDIFSQLSKEDFTTPEGEWLRSCCDAAVMIPALELAGPRHHFIPDLLYLYNSENPHSDWRRHPGQVNRDHDWILQPHRRKV